MAALKKVLGFLKQAWIYLTLVYWLILEAGFFFFTREFNLWLLPINFLVALGVALLTGYSFKKMLDEP